MSNDWEEAKRLNKNKHLLQIGDMAISKKYGIGFVKEIELHDDVLNPILVEFRPCNLPGCYGYDKWYDCEGNGSGTTETDESVKFYRKLDLKNKEEES